MQHALIHSHLQKHNYSFLNIIGKGGFSICMRVKNLRYDNIEFVCKVLALKDEEEAKVSYFSEIETLISIQSSNIVSIYDHFVEDNYFYIILEYCHKGSLDSVIKEKTIITNEDLRNYMRTLITALNVLHQNKIAHHDIKPANFFLDQYGRAKLGDFGIAKRYPDEPLSTSFRGTMPYLAPEIFRFAPYNPFKADIWALGVSLYEMATGRPPFRGADKTELKNSIMMSCYQAPEGLSKDLKNILFACLRRNPADRPDTMTLIGMLEVSVQTQRAPGIPLMVRSSLGTQLKFDAKQKAFTSARTRMTRMAFSRTHINI